ncbi:hypothetical protein [Bdellovibrio sp. HCB337]|uniref:hypothetical protein n=1 Tax=Bdellovibrio sp. HCB337 TaxID=3394358 RepID=UPI0039A5EB31
MKNLVMYSVVASLLGQNVAYANRIDSVVDSGVASVAQEIAITDQALAVAEEQLIHVENSIIELQQHGKIARYTTIGLAATGAIIGIVGAIALRGASPEKGTGVFIAASIPAALSGVSHVIYGLQRKEIDKEKVLADLTNAQTQLAVAEQVNDPALKSSITKLQQSLQALGKSVTESKNSGLNEFTSETATVMLAITGMGLIVGSTSSSMGSNLGLSVGYGLTLAMADLMAIPAVISALSDNNKAQVLEEVQKTRQAVSAARKSLQGKK